MKVCEENCKGCVIFDERENDNMIKFNICHKREMTGCEKK